MKYARAFIGRNDVTTMANAPLYISIKNTVVAIDRTSGGEIWRRELESSSVWTAGIVCTMHVISEAIYVGAHGELFCLSPSTGEIRWRNALTGLGASIIVFGDNEASVTLATAATQVGAMAGVGVATLGV
jgi:outer membrane protein assembly factor BamB